MFGEAGEVEEEFPGFFGRHDALEVFAESVRGRLRELSTMMRKLEGHCA